MNEYLLLGVDGGGTSCRVRLCDAAGATLGEGRAGSANVRLGVAQAYDAILKATDDALAAAGLDRAVLSRTWAGFGLAGAVNDSRCREVTDYAHPFAGVTVATDAHTACLGAHLGGTGGILILGTGSCGVVHREGRFDVIGGWGFMISDQGSGAWLGLNAVRQALMAHDGVVEAGALSRALMARFDDSPVKMLDWSETARPRDYGAFAPLVLEHAAAGDPLAVRLLQQSASEASALIARLRALGAADICLMGGLSEPLKRWLAADHAACLREPRGDAMDGALLLAKQHFTRLKGDH